MLSTNVLPATEYME
jgi:hypothetical protein